MARKENKRVHKVQMTEGKRNIIHQLLHEYDIETAEDLKNRPLDDIYSIVYIHAIHYSVWDNGIIKKLAAYVLLSINTEGRKEVLTITT